MRLRLILLPFGSVCCWIPKMPFILYPPVRCSPPPGVSCVCECCCWEPCTVPEWMITETLPAISELEPPLPVTVPLVPPLPTAEPPLLPPVGPPAPCWHCCACCWWWTCLAFSAALFLTMLQTDRERKMQYAMSERERLIENPKIKYIRKFHQESEMKKSSGHKFMPRD